MKATEGWLDDIKVGDEVYWVQRRREPQVMVVVRLTKARVFVRPAGQNTPIEYDFHRGDRGGMGGYKLEGRSVGGWSGLLYPITPENIAEEEGAAQARVIRQQAEGLALRTRTVINTSTILGMTREQRDRLVALLDELEES
jgi:hypothetical protein